ncbi:gp43 [Burkholderia pseudomallei]|nr:gp43 [Burkholderia pseudomallei]
MNDQQQSRADALTDDQRQMLGEALTEYFTELDRDIGIDTPDRILSLIDYHDDRFIDDLIDRAIVPALSISANETGAEGAAITDHDAKGLEIIAGWLYKDGLVEPAAMLRRLASARSPAMAAAALAEEHSTIECQAHSGPDCTECGGTGVWSGKADERAASWHCEDPVQKCRAQCDSCAKQARAATEIADERAVSFEAWCDRFPEISAVERLRDAWQEARATASPAAERVTAALQALSADVHILGDGWANDEAMIGLAKKYLRVEPKPASPELSLWRDFVLLAVTDTAPQPAQADAQAETREPLNEVLFGNDEALEMAADALDRLGQDSAAAGVRAVAYELRMLAHKMRCAPADAGEAVAHMRVRSTDAGSTSHAIDIAPEAAALDLKPGEYLLYLAPPTTRAAYLTTTLSPDQRISMAAKLFCFANELLNGADHAA